MTEALADRITKIAGEIEREGMPDNFESDDEPFATERQNQFEAAYEQRKLTMCEIVRNIASQLGFGEPVDLDETQLRVVVRDACDAVDNWESDVEMQLKPPEPKNALQKLLREYHEQGEMILDIMDEEIEAKGDHDEI